MIRHLPLTRGRVRALAIGVPLILAAIGWSGLNWVALAGQGSYPVRLSLPLTGGTAGVSIGTANLTVGQAAGGAAIAVTGRVHYSLDRAGLTWHRSRSGVSLSMDCHQLVGLCYADLSLSVPPGARTHLSDGSGNIALHGLTGYVGAWSGSGNIGGTGLASAQVTASDGSGDIALTFTRVPGRVSVTDGSGNVTLILPPGDTRYRVSANTSSGSRTVNVPTTTSAQSRHVIDVSDGSGNITIMN